MISMRKWHSSVVMNLLLKWNLLNCKTTQKGRKEIFFSKTSVNKQLSLKDTKWHGTVAGANPGKMDWFASHSPFWSTNIFVRTCIFICSLSVYTILGYNEIISRGVKRIYGTVSSSSLINCNILGRHGTNYS